MKETGNQHQHQTKILISKLNIERGARPLMKICHAESRKATGTGIGDGASKAAGAARSSGGGAAVEKKPITSFTKDILTTYQLFHQSNRLDRLLRKFLQFHVIKTKTSAALATAPSSGPPQVYPFISSSSTASIIGGSELISNRSKLKACDNVQNTVNKTPTSTALIEHFLHWRTRRQQQLGGVGIDKSKKPRRSYSKSRVAGGSKDSLGFKAFISKQDPGLVKHLRRHSLLIDPKDQDLLLREVYSTSQDQSNNEEASPASASSASSTDQTRVPGGPPYIPIDLPFPFPLTSKGGSSNAKTGDKHVPSSSKGTTSKVSRDTSLPRLTSTPPVINLPAPHEIPQSTTKSGGAHAHKPTKKHDRVSAEASVMQRYGELQKQGMIYEFRMPKLVEPSRIKSQWDYLLEEMQWMTADFAQERKWKGAAARKCARMIEKYWKDQEDGNRISEKDETLLGRKITSFIAKEIRNFWSNVQRLVEYKELAKIEELRKKAANLHLSMMVDQTEKFADMVASSLRPEPGQSITPASASVVEEQDKMETEAVSDDDFKPDEHESDDDEETIAKEEAQAKDVSKEVDLLAKESTQDLYEIYPKWLVDKMMGKSADADEGPGSPPDSPSDGSETSGSDATDSSVEESEDDDKNNETGTETPKEEWDLTTLIKSLSPEKTAQAAANDQELNTVTEFAQSFQPTGNTLSSTQVKTKVPILLKHNLREYQHVGLDWLVTMYEKKLNGILADEMGLGKTIQTIALLAHLACEKGNWGPHLIIVPTSVMLNWEMEFKKWCPGFKLLTYYGSMKERRLKRKGWTKPNTFHVCITSYKLVVQDHHVFRRKAWKYLILDEAQNIKNFKSQRWQQLLHFNARRRLLLTGTPLQNNLMELWSLLHFLMPNVFQSHREFREWFSNPVSGMVEGNADYNEKIIRRLHKVLRPFILRRLKSEVEKQLPQKHEHVVLCPLSKRQRFLYEEFMSRTRTRETLESGNLLSVINVLMQLRKVCNHPNLFESRPIISPLRTEGITTIIPSLVWNMLEELELRGVHFAALKPTLYDQMLGFWNANRVWHLQRPTTYLKYAGLLAIEEVSDARAQLTTNGFTVGKKTTYEAKGDLLPGSPHSKTTLPIVLISEVDPTTYFDDGEFFGALTREADRLNNSNLDTPRIVTPPRTTMKRPLLALSAPEEARPVVPRKVSKLSTGQVELIRTTSGMPGVILTGSSYVNGLSTSIATEKVTPSVAEGHDRVFMIDAAPLSYSEPMEALADVVVSAISDSNKDQDGGEEPYGRPKRFVEHLSELAPMSQNERTAQVEYNPFFEFRYNLERKAAIILSNVVQSSKVDTIELSPSPQKRKLSDDESSDEYEDSDEETSTSSSPIKPMTPNMFRASKREFRPEDANPESNMLRTLKRRETPKLDPNAGLTWLHEKGIDLATFDTTDMDIRRLQGRVYVIRRLNKINRKRCAAYPFFGYDTVDACSVFGPPPPWKPFRATLPLNRDFKNNGYFKFGYNEVQSYRIIHASYSNHERNHPTNKWRFADAFIKVIGTSETIIDKMINNVLPSIIYIPSVETPPIQSRVLHPSPSNTQRLLALNNEYQAMFKHTLNCLHPITTRMATQFPDPRLIQYDCGKLQKLDLLLRRLKSGDHRVLIFTQMTKMLDVLEAFLNYHGYIYMRLDGTTKIDQRQLLMEKFNTDRRIFCFILSTRSGGIGVNLTGADTVIFYDSDWNPTMDAQAQDRCHRIGQTRDVHIYRLVSEKTVEENILLKSHQKKLLSELAIEGGNFTTAYFKKNTIRDLFDTDVVLTDASLFTKQPQEQDDSLSETDFGNFLGQEPDKNVSMMESALSSAEDETDVQAARTVRAEAAAELAEFDESIPLETSGEAREFEEPSTAAAEMENILSALTAVERFAFKQMEANIHEWTTETYESAARAVENQKRQWELEQLAMNEAQNAPASTESDDEEMITYLSADAQNKVWMAQDGFDEGEFMPLWAPPTPPIDDTDVYIDTALQTLYDQEIILEHELPPVYVPPLKKKASTLPKPTTSTGYPPLIPSPTQMDISTDQKKLPLKTHKREEPIFAPKSLFERPNPQVNKLRRDFKLQKHNRPSVSPSALTAVTSPAKPLGPESVSFPVVSPPKGAASTAVGLDNPPWTPQEDNALLEGVTTMCELPQSLMVVSPSQTVNWDLISDHVNQISITHRAPKQCKTRYETVVGPREEGKMIFDSPALVKKKKSKAFLKLGPPSPQRARPQIKTAQLLLQDNYQSHTEVFFSRFEQIRKIVERKQKKPLPPPGTQKVGKQAVIFMEHAINYDVPQTAQAIAHARLERIQMERRKMLAAQEAARIAAQEATRIAAQEAARMAAQTPIGTITLPAGQTLSVQGGSVQQQSNSLLLQTLPQKLTPAQMEILKQNIVMSAQLRQSQQLGNASAPLRPPYQRAPIDPTVSLQGVKRIQVVPNSVQSTLGGVSFAITSSSITTTAQQTTIIPFSSTITAQSSPIIQSQLQSSNISPGTIYQRSTDGSSLPLTHNVKRIQLVANSLQPTTFSSVSGIPQQNIIALNTSSVASQLSSNTQTHAQARAATAGQMLGAGPLPPVSVFQRGVGVSGADGVSLQGVKRIQVVSNPMQPGGIAFAVATTTGSPATSQHSVISISAPMSIGTTGGQVVQQHASAPIITMAPAQVVSTSTVQSLGSLLSSTTTTAQRFQNIQGAGGTPLAALIKSQGQKPGQPQAAFISSNMPLTSLNTIRPLIVRPRTNSPQQPIQSLQMQQLTQQQQAQLVVSSGGTSGPSIFTLTSPMTSAGQSTQRVTLVQQAPAIAVTSQGTQGGGQPIIAVPSSQIGSIATSTPSNLPARLQALTSAARIPVTALVKGSVAPNLSTQCYITTPIQYTPLKPGATTQAQMPTQVIVQTTPKQLQQFQQVFKQVIIRQPVQMMQGQAVAVSLGGPLARPAVSQGVPIRTAVPISAIAQIGGSAQAHAMPRGIRLPLTLPLHTSTAPTIAISAATAQPSTTSGAAPTPRLLTNPSLIPVTAPLIPNISRGASAPPPPPVTVAPPQPTQFETSQFESSSTSKPPASTPEDGSGSSQG